MSKKKSIFVFSLILALIVTGILFVPIKPTMVVVTHKGANIDVVERIANELNASISIGVVDDKVDIYALDINTNLINVLRTKNVATPAIAPKISFLLIIFLILSCLNNQKK